jgi:hypothetical protein
MIVMGCSAISIFYIVKNHKQSVQLQKALENTRKMEKLYGYMAQELRNIADAKALHDDEGIRIFYDKLLELHKQFMEVEID